MDWKALGQSLLHAAPALGAALGGPAGAAVGELLARTLGTASTPEAVSAAIATPEGQAALAELNARYQLMGQALAADQAAMVQGARTVRAEVRADSWMTKNWRPLTMLVFVSIVANNYLLAPYLQAWLPSNPLHPVALTLPMPPDLWALLKIGLGGYVVGRSGEKMMGAWASSARP